MTCTLSGWPRYFYPRPPRGGRLSAGGCLQLSSDISIHALREEGDVTSPDSRLQIPDFYPRPPRGGRLRTPLHPPLRRGFLSTPSARRATAAVSASTMQGKNFYPRPPRGGRLRVRLSRHPIKNFYPRPPRGGRRILIGRPAHLFLISIHALREEGDGASSFFRFFRCRISIHALREEGDGSFAYVAQYVNKFLSTPSARRATSPSAANRGS